MIAGVQASACSLADKLKLELQQARRIENLKLPA
jgi:hypothetical protein